MAGAKLRDAEIPWCAAFLVLATIACHSCVLVGNMKTASALADIGRSTGGWSDVGLGLARAFEEELDDLMANISSDMINILENLTQVTSEFDTVISIIGNATDNAVAQGTGLFLMQMHTGNVTDSLSDLTSFLRPLVMNAVTGIIQQVTDSLSSLVRAVWLVLKPILLQIGSWLVTFGNALTSGMETFSNSLDKVQKIFDQIMSQLNGHGDGADPMMDATWGLFDVDGDGVISVEDLRTVAELYSINALSGSKPEDLVKDYDTNNDGVLNMPELMLMVDDPAIPNAPSTIIRQFARKLSEVANQLEGATMRDQAALALVRYLQLVCAQNQTKVRWISDALGNGSLVLDFTAAVYGKLCLEEHSPESLTTQDVAAKVITTMYKMHPQRTIEAYNLLVNTTWWTTNGFNLLDHPKCVNKTGAWVRSAQAQILSGNITSILQMQKMVQTSRMMAELNVRRHLQRKEQAHRERQAALFSGRASQVLLMHLSGGVSASDAGGSTNPLAEQAISAGQPCAPTTLIFKAWLSSNATGTCSMLQDLSFGYSATSSSTLDTFATQIQGMIKKATSFINMMEKYATTSAINQLEDTINEFLRSAEGDIVTIIQSKLGDLIDDIAPMLGNALEGALDSVANRLGDLIAGLINGPLETAVQSPIGDVVEGLLGNSSLGNTFTHNIADTISGTLSDVTSNQISSELKKMLEDLVNQGISSLAGGLESSSLAGLQADAHRQLVQAHEGGAALLQAGRAVEALDLEISGTWQTLLGQISSLTNLIPAATSTMKNARSEIMKAAGNLDSIFQTFRLNGPPIFDVVSRYWSLIWTLYFTLFATLMVFNLYYALWASGWFGGPKPSPDTDGAAPPRTWCDRLCICCRTCGVCMTHCHDTHCCFWSMVILMQVIVLILFVVSIVLALIAGIKLFITAGCAQIYLLGDPDSCAETIQTLRQFTATFHVQFLFEPISGVCPTNSLLACQMISAKMKSSMILTTVFSFGATILSMQVIIETAIMHEQARYRRMFTKAILDELEDEARSSK